MPFQPGYSPLEQRMEHLEREFVRLGQSGQNANQQAQGAAGRGAVVVEATGTLTGPIPEDQVIFDAAGGHDHSAGNSTAVPMSGDVTGTNQAAVVVGIEGVPLSGAPAAGDDHKFIRYDLGLGQFVYSGAVMLAPDAVDRNTIKPTADTNSGLIIEGHSATQSATLFQCNVPGFGGAVFIGPNGQLTVSPAPGGSPVLFEVDEPTSFDVVMNVWQAGSGQAVKIKSPADTDKGLVITPHSASQSGDLLQCLGGDLVPILRVGAGATGATER
jgi:hypothetical protein